VIFERIGVINRVQKTAHAAHHTRNKTAAGSAANSLECCST